MLRFADWLVKKKSMPPDTSTESDRLMRVVMRAGAISEGDLKEQVKLSRETVDQLLVRLLELGLIVATGTYGERVFRPAVSPAARLLQR